MISFFPTDQVMGRSIGNYNDNLSREALGRMQEAAAITQAELQAKAQQQALQQSYFANQQANALERQKLDQLAKYQQGQLDNSRIATQAQMDWQKALMQGNAGESEKDRANRLEIAKLTVGGKISPAEATATANADMNEQMARALEKTANNAETEIATDANSLREAISERNKFKMGGERGLLSSIGDKERTGIISKLSPSLQQAVMASGKSGDVDAMLTAANTAFQAKASTHAANAAKWQGEGLIAKDWNQWKAMYTNPFRKALQATPGTTTSTNAPSSDPQSPSFFPQPSAVTPAVIPTPQPVAANLSAPPQDRVINVKRSDGSIVKIMAGSFDEARRRDPGVQIVTELTTPTPATVPAAIPSRQASGPLTAPPGMMEFNRLRTLLSSPNGEADIGQNPLMSAFKGWTASELPAIQGVVARLEAGQPVSDRYGNPVRVTPEALIEAKKILMELGAPLATKVDRYSIQ